METLNKYTNHLIEQSSPYLLLHAHNPVNWYPWGQEALEKARKEDKLLIISIGYAACHWCHVMEEESFSDEEVARLMNDHFVSVKVDREERPDIDQVYMDAAQLLTGQGGWPLNAIALPDGRPFFAGTYFPKHRWITVLKKIHQLYRANPESVLEQAEHLTAGIQTMGMIEPDKREPVLNPNQLDKMVTKWLEVFDFQWGGDQRAPKFPLPGGYRFLLVYHHLNREVNSGTVLAKQALEAVRVTLDRMAMGGIYDQVGGGFARYSTDEYWKIPHFEKMLYDNGQLVSLYSYAYQLTRNPLYKRVVYETLDFVERELLSPELPTGGRGFYSSLDADSEGQEGKYYTWTEAEIKTILGDDAGIMIDYYNITGNGNWEKGSNILYRTIPDHVFCNDRKINQEQLQEKINRAKQKLMEARSKRRAPACDDKILTAWNALMLTGYVDAYHVFNDKGFLNIALENAHFLINRMMETDGRLYRNYKNGKATINAFLDDYAFTIQAFISLYRATFSEKWLYKAEVLLKYSLEHFFNSKTGLFYYTSDLDPELIARKTEIPDNVIPSSNSQMALNLFWMGEYFYNEDYRKKSISMVNSIKENMVRNGSYFANWAMVFTVVTHPPVELAIVGADWEQKRCELDNHFLPNIILMGGSRESTLPGLKNKLIDGQTTLYLCKNKVCKLPVTDVNLALKQLE